MRWREVRMLTDMEIHGLRADEGLLRRELESAGAKFRGKACKCIFHDDSHASAGVYSDDGAWKYKCQGCGIGGDIFDIRAAINKTTGDDELRKEGMRRAPVAKVEKVETFPSLDAIKARFRTIEAVYEYRNPDTRAIDMAVIRWRNADGKQFTQCSPAPGGQWWMKAPAIRPLYNRGRLRTAARVVIVEGEKCVHALHEVGIVATTSPQGAKSADKADWTPLAGKPCVLWADHDAAGEEYMQKVQNILQGLGCNVSKVAHETLELGEGGDAADFVARYGEDKALSRDAVVDVLDDARTIGIIGDYAKEAEEVIAGKRRAIPFGLKQLAIASRALMPGTVTCIFAPPGATKSLFMVEALSWWIVNGYRACVFMLEDDRNYHLRRVHAQIAKNANITSNDWVEQNAIDFRESLQQHQGILDAVGKCIWDAPNEEVSHEMLETWVEERAKAGFDVISIDPVTAAATSEKPWIADQKFIFKIKTLMRRYNKRAILVTHPRKGPKQTFVSLDDMAGGAAYQRFSHTVLHIEWNEKMEEVGVRRSVAWPVEMVTPNRIISIPKARNGPGARRRIAYNFNSETLCFDELGLIEKP